MLNSTLRAVLAFVLGAGALVCGAAHASGRLELQVSGGRISLDAQATTVKEVLDALAAKNVVRVTMDEASSFRARLTTVNKRFGRRDLASALGVILEAVPHELVKGPDGAVAEVRLLSPYTRQLGDVTVTPVVPSRAAVRAGRFVAAGAVPATSLPPSSSRSFSLEAEQEGQPPANTPAQAANSLAARIAERRAAARQGAQVAQASRGDSGAAGLSAPLPIAAPASRHPGDTPTSAAAAPAPVASPRASNRPPIATPVPLEVPANPYTINGMEMPSLASAEEKAGFRADRAGGHKDVR